MQPSPDTPNPSREWGRIPKGRADNEHAHRLTRCLDLFDRIEAYQPTGALRDQMVRACQLGHGRDRETALRLLLARIEREIGEALR